MHTLNSVIKSCNKFSVLLKPHLPSTTFIATICSKELRDPNYKRPKPFDYQNKMFTFFHWHVDSTLKRFDENTKVIVVDGNIGAGKTKFAKYLAEQFDMKYIPEPNMDLFYVTQYGYDLRLLDPVMPPSFKSCDVKTFYQNPRHRNLGTFQLKMFMLRYIDYIQALCHLVNTGEGIVMDRSVFSDFVFMDSMCNMGYLRREVRNFYHEVFENCVDELLRPHLVIYLDVTPEVALQRIKERNDPIEVNSEVFKNVDYLKHIDHAYKNVLLPRLATHSEILVYDWNNYGDEDVIIEDIERIDFDTYNPYSKRLKDWFYESDWTWGNIRWKYTNSMHKFLKYSKLMPYGCPELTHPGEEVQIYQRLMNKVPGNRYEKGYNPHMKESVLFKGVNRAYYCHQLDFFPAARKTFGLLLDI